MSFWYVVVLGNWLGFRFGYGLRNSFRRFRRFRWFSCDKDLEVELF